MRAYPTIITCGNFNVAHVGLHRKRENHVMDRIGQAGHIHNFNLAFVAPLWSLQLFTLHVNTGNTYVLNGKWCSMCINMYCHIGTCVFEVPLTSGFSKIGDNKFVYGIKYII